MKGAKIPLGLPNRVFPEYPKYIEKNAYILQRKRHRAVVKMYKELMKSKINFTAGIVKAEGAETQYYSGELFAHDDWKAFNDGEYVAIFVW